MHRRFTVGEAFETPIRGKSKYSRAYLRAHPGDHPVYSAATAGPVGSIDTYDHEGDFLSWSTNGYAGRTLVLSGRFSSTSDRALLRSRVELLDLEYCAIVLAPKFEAAARGRRQDGSVRNEYTKLPPHGSNQHRIRCSVHSNRRAGHRGSAGLRRAMGTSTSASGTNHSPPKNARAVSGTAYVR